MDTVELEKKIQTLVNQENHDNFIYELLALYGTSQSQITRSKKDNNKLSKKDNQIIIKRKLFFELVSDGRNLLSTITELDNDSKTHFHKPRFIIVTDFQHIVAVDTKLKNTPDYTLAVDFDKLYTKSDFFLPWAGKEKYIAPQESVADIKAAEKMAKIYDEIYYNNASFAHEYNHDLNQFLTRLLFCFFAEDTGIFNKKSLFTNALSNHTDEDAHDLKSFFETLFAVLDEKDMAKKKELPSYLQEFPYVNGQLFTNKIHIPELTPKVRKLMIDCGRLNWKEINPDIFGSMFQAVKIAEVRSGLGQHYTSVSNIMKVINPLFMDDLREEFENSAEDVRKLKALQLRLSKIRIFDPACGSGNFLIIAFKQMKLLEMEIIKRINYLQNQDNLQMNLSQIELKQFYGIEIDDFACEIAKLSLWLAEHQMNCKFKEEIGEPRPTLPLRESGHIVCGNACRIDWEDVCPKYIYKNNFREEFERSTLKNTPLGLDIPKEEAEVYILGNPPYIGARKQEENHKKDMDYVLSKDFNKYKDLDYIACWFYKGALYIKEHNAKLAFVTTNSVCQGQQIDLLWSKILNNLQIFFAYEAFKWANNAKYNAGVTVVIIGISNISNKPKSLYCDGKIYTTKHVNAYLKATESSITIKQTKKVMSRLPKMNFGNMPNDGGGLILSKSEKNNLIAKYPEAEKFIKLLLGSQEFIRGQERFCLWIKNCDVTEALNIPFIRERIELVRRHRENSKDKGTKKLAQRPHQFRDLNESSTYSIIIPRVSSERRAYIPIGYVNKDTIISDAAQAIYDAEPWIFGVVTSRMHMIWVNAVGGKLETRFRYSAELCYNTFPFPPIDEKQKKRIELCVNEILAVREKYSEKTMAELYDPDKMPKDLFEAHQSLDIVIEQCYKKAPFKSDEERLEHLFKRYEMMTNNASDDDFKQLELL